MSRTPRLVVHGAGRMGRLVAAEAAAQGFRLAGFVSRHHPGGLEQGRWFPGLDALPDIPEVLIDFTLPAGAAAAARWCGAHGVPLVSGTTGLEALQERVFDEAARGAPVLHAPNFSPGVNATLALVRQARAMLGDLTSASITDVHHAHKKDAPSGTALALAEALAPLEPTIDSRREGEVVGEHRVVMDLPGEQLVIEHRALDRAIFARGALQAARWLLDQPPGRYRALDWVTDQQG